ncbi:hypothetical protein [Natrinema salinisoli]|uniref:hypothetical protein n=1 Tax=Natrinema salinisoli TaxID=2878535 RepID=UPI001CF04C61|nr:hypothetical protein [Natrinema salinisoli]
MDRTDWFLALITYLLAAQIFVTADGNTTPTFIVLSVLAILLGIPFYLLIHTLAVILEPPGKPILGDRE